MADDGNERWRWELEERSRCNVGGCKGANIFLTILL
jgi:hypothetical protein